MDLSSGYAPSVPLRYAYEVSLVKIFTYRVNNTKLCGFIASLGGIVGYPVKQV